MLHCISLRFGYPSYPRLATDELNRPYMLEGEAVDEIRAMSRNDYLVPKRCFLKDVGEHGKHSRMDCRLGFFNSEKWSLEWLVDCRE